MGSHQPTTGLREFIEAVDSGGELKRISGASWEKEMGAIAGMIQRDLGNEAPAILFEDVPGYSKGYRTFYNQLGSVKRLSLCVGLPGDYDDLLSFAVDFHNALTDVDPRPANEVSNGPILENTREGTAVDLTGVPVPLHNEQDGGRYMGTADCVVTRDPETHEINVGTYRAQLRNERQIHVYMSPGKDGRIHRDKYFERDEPMPIALTFGQTPALFLASGAETPMNELSYAGGIQGQPIDVIPGAVTGLPIPADAEIAIEGYMQPDSSGIEGPFAEWTGYYGGGEREEPFVDVEAMYFRDEPILTCRYGGGKVKRNLRRASMRSVLLKNELESAGVPGVEGVWTHEAGGCRQFNAISLRQRYAGHARQAAYVAAQCGAGGYAGKWVVVVDDDIEPTNLEEVAWAMSTRCDPTSDVEFIDRAWSTRLEPLVEDTENPFNSRAIIDATIPYERLEEFPPTAAISPEYEEEIREKWGEEIRTE